MTVSRCSVDNALIMVTIEVTEGILFSGRSPGPGTLAQYLAQLGRLVAELFYRAVAMFPASLFARSMV